MNLKDVLSAVDTVLVIDWPSRDVPEALVRAGFNVVVHGGPGPEDYSLYRLENGNVVDTRVGREPERADLVYSYRPVSELREIIATANRLGAGTIWTQSGVSAEGHPDKKGCWVQENDLRQAEDLVRSAGLRFLSQPYIGEAAREFMASR